jgi:hypothetical protein
MNDKEMYQRAIEKGLINPLSDEEFLKLYNQEIKTKVVVNKKSKKIEAKKEKDLTPEAKNNWEKLCQAILNPKEKQQEKEKKLLMDYEEARAKVFKIMIDRLGLNYKPIQKAWYLPNGRKMLFPQPFKDTMKNLTKYFIQDSTSTCNLYKGIFLHGPVGTGKTTILDIFSIFTNENNLPTKFTLLDAMDFQRKVTLSGVGEIENLFKKYPGTIAFDDLGFEKITKVFGVEIDTLQEVIFKAQKRFKNSGKVLHATSNLGLFFDFGHGLLSDRYDTRITDRCNELFNFVSLTGKSNR